MTDLTSLTALELLQLQGSVITELRQREIVRTSNAPLGDYTEWLVARTLNLDLEVSSKAGFDAQTKDGIRIQIKGRRPTKENQSRQLSAIRKYDEQDFDELIAVFFNENFTIKEVYRMPHKIIGKYAKYRSHPNAHVLIMQGPILEDPDVEEISHKFRM